MLLPSAPFHDTDLTADPYPWADTCRDECDWCGKTSCFCEADPEGVMEQDFEDDDAFFDAIDDLEATCDEHGTPY